MYAVVNIADRRFETPSKIVYAKTLELAESYMEYLESKGIGTGSSDWQHVIVPAIEWTGEMPTFSYHEKRAQVLARVENGQVVITVDGEKEIFWQDCDLWDYVQDFPVRVQAASFYKNGKPSKAAKDTIGIWVSAQGPDKESVHETYLKAVAEAEAQLAESCKVETKLTYDGNNS